ncbi:MAG TPA: gamma-glutamylcyclotransferase family protein [Vicinamibacteria bacterium]|nr:gamma-glutamylcyclotransferase family protein [Vicinamibacteria bacterium]
MEAPETRRLYFAYGSNMDSRQMSERCRQAVPAGLGTLPDHRFIINQRGVASVVPRPGARVPGLLWSLTVQDEEVLDRYEGVPKGLYRKVLHSIERPSRAAPSRALVYVASDQKAGTPREGYLEQVLAAAQALGLPAEYIAELETWRVPPPVP